MAAQLEITEAKGRIEELLSRARSGEEILLADGGKLVVRIVPAGVNNGVRIFGEFAGKLRMSDDFAAPLTDAELAEWEK